MAMKATFDADFSRFLGELSKADVKLRDFGTGSDKASTKLDKMANALNGNKIAEQAGIAAAALASVGGASNVTTAQLSKLSAPIREFVELADRRGQAVPEVFRKITEEAKRTELQLKATKFSLADINTGTLTKIGTTAALGVGVAFGVTTRAAIQFESAFANVRKTVDATDEEFARLEAGLRQMSREIPTAVTELSSLAAIGGQFGVSQAGLLKFTRTVADLSVAVDGISGEQAAAGLAQIANITRTSEQDFDRLASTLVRIGNAGTSTESDILEMTKRLAGAGTQAGFTVQQLFGIAGALANVGIEAEAGGSAVSKVFLRMKDAALDGGKALETFAAVAGQSSRAFADAFQSTPDIAFQAFIDGLGRMQREGKSLTGVFEALELTDGRLKDAFGRLALSSGDVAKQMQLANDEFSANTALVDEAGKKYGTTENQLKVFWNRLNDINITLGGPSLQALNAVLKAVTPLTEQVGALATGFANMSEPTRNTIVALGLGTGVAGVLLVLTAKTIDSVREIGKLIVVLRGLAVAEGVAGSVGILSGSIGALATNVGRLKALLPGGIATLLGAGGAALTFGAAGAFVAAKKGVETYTDSLGRIVDQQGVLSLSQRTTGEAPRSFGEAWNVARAIVDQAAKSTEGLTDDQKTLKRTLDQLNPYLSEQAAKAGLLAGQLRLAGLAAKQASGPLAAVTLTTKPTGTPRTSSFTAPTPVDKGAAAARLRADTANQQRLDALTGRNVVQGALQSVADINTVGVSRVSAAQATKVFESIFEARAIAKAIAPDLVDGFTAALTALSKNPAIERAAREAGAKIFRTIGDSSELKKLTGARAITGRDLNPIPATFTTSTADTYALARGGLAALGTTQDEINRRFDASVKKTTDWRTSLQDVSRAFSELANISGGLDPIVRQVGVFVSSLQAAESLVTGIGKAFNKEFNFGDSKAGKNAAAGISGAIQGFDVGKGFGRVGGTLAGAAGGALAGAPYAAATGGASVAIGAIAGGIGGYFGARSAEKELRKLKDLQSQQLVAQYGTLDALLATVDRLGLNSQTFLERFYGEPQEFARGVSDLTAGLTREKNAADALGKALTDVQRKRGVLSPVGRAALEGVRDGGPAEEMTKQFRADQSTQLVGGLTSMLQAGSLSSAAVSGAGIGLGAAFAQLRKDGAGVVEALRVLEPAMQAFQTNAVNAGKGSTAEFDALKSLLDSMTSETLGPFITQAHGASDALAAMSNLGIVTQDSFSGLSASITDAFFALERDGKGGIDAVRLLQGPLQNVWQLMQDFGYEASESTKSLIDFASGAGLIGDKFRPAEEKLVQGVDRIVDRLDTMIGLFTGDMVTDARAGADAAGQAILDEFAQVQPRIRVSYDRDELPSPPGRIRPDTLAPDETAIPPSTPKVPGQRQPGTTDAAIQTIQRAASAQGGDVYMDGRQVGEVVMRHAGGILEFHGA